MSRRRRGRAAPPAARAPRWVERLVEVRTTAGPRTVPAHVYGRLALTGAGTITHVPSGYCVPLPGRQQAEPETARVAALRLLIERLAELDWDWPEPDLDSLRYRRTITAAAAIVLEWQEETMGAAGAGEAAAVEVQAAVTQP